MSTKKAKECIRIQFNVTNKGTIFAAFCYKYRLVQKCLDAGGSVLNNECQVTLVPLLTAYVTLLMPSVYTRKLHKHPFQTPSQICEKRLLALSCLSVRPHVTTRLPLGGFSWNLIFEYFSQIRRKDLCTLMLISRSVLLRMRNISDRSCRENQNTRSFLSKPSPKIVLFMKFILIYWYWYIC